MKLIFIRHAEPDYEHDLLTEKGYREAEILGCRVAGWDVTDFYCSPLGRAKETAKPALKLLRREAVTFDWLREFDAPITNYEDPTRRRIPWDFRPYYLKEHPELFSSERWSESPLMKSGKVKEAYDWVCEGFDRLLKAYGYERDGVIYQSPKNVLPSDHFMEYNGTTIACMEKACTDETTLVFFCHLGVMMLLVSHLLNTSPVTLWQGMFIPPASITVLSSEERNVGEAYFRCQVVGDTSHLREAGEPVSYYGGFSRPFQG